MQAAAMSHLDSCDIAEECGNYILCFVHTHIHRQDKDTSYVKHINIHKT